MILAHKIELDATRKQKRYFASAVGCARFVWNWALAEWNRQYQAWCGHEEDRDLNAAKNIRTAGLAGIYAHGPEGADRRRKAKMKPCRIEVRTTPCPQVDTPYPNVGSLVAMSLVPYELTLISSGACNSRRNFA